MRPNIIVFMTDHQRGDTILEDSLCKTPNIDRFRKSAVTFSHAYGPAPHCCPARATLFSGLYPSGHGVWNNVNVSNTLSRGLFDNVRLFSEDLKDSGYDMYFSGKWHVSAEHGPEDYGFENIYQTGPVYHKFNHEPQTTEWDWYKNRADKVDTGSEQRTEGRIIREGYEEYIQYGVDESPYKDAEVAQAAVEKLEEIDGSNPFFMFVGPLGPHDPYFCPQRFIDMYDINEIELPKSFSDEMKDKPAMYRRCRDRYANLTPEEHRECIRRFYAFCSYEDYLFGKILDKVKEKDLMKNTIIVYMSDHGDYIGSHGLWAKGIPCFKEAYHVCAMAGGGPIANPGRIEDSFISLADWAPTFLELAGIKTERYFAGHSLVPFLQGEKPQVWRKYCFSQSNGNEAYAIQRAVWDENYKYVYNSFDYDELYDLKKDPDEMHNLLYDVHDISKSKYAKIVRELSYHMWKYAYQNQDNCVNPYIMTAYAPYGPGIIFDRQGKLLDETPEF